MKHRIIVDIVTGMSLQSILFSLLCKQNNLMMMSLDYIMTQCRLVRRDDFYDIFLDGKKCGSGSWGLVYTALYFYRAEGFDVKVIE